MVALRKESVDRNIFCVPLFILFFGVALRKESVDRNNDDFSVESGEIVVALRKESVDRNLIGSINRAIDIGRSPQGERG